MHEMSIAIQIIRLASRHAEEASAGSISQVELDIGRLSGIELESLRFALSVATRETMLEGAEFRINTIDPVFECGSCHKHYTPEEWPGNCPNCGQNRPLLLKGNELQIKSLLIE